MTRIKNIPKRNNPLIKAIRGLLEHRAAWLYLLLDEAEKRGLQTEEFVKAAILRCGCFHGDRLCAGAGAKDTLCITPAAVYIPKDTPHAIRPVDATVGKSGGLIPVCLNGEYITLPVDAAG